MRLTITDRLLRGSIGQALLMLVLVALVPVLIGQTVAYGVRLRAQQADELQANLEMARAVAAAMQSYVQDVVRQEHAIGTALTLPRPMPPDQAARFLRRSAGQYEAVRDYSWISPEGRVTLSSNPAGPGIDVSDRAFFRAILAGHAWAVSDLLEGRISGHPTVVIARGIRDGSGALQGVVAASVEPNTFHEAIGIRRLREGTVGVTDSRGVVVYRHPEAALAGRDRGRLVDDPLVRRALAGEEATGTFTSPFDGRRRLGARVPIAPFGWVAGASRPVDEVMGPAARRIAGEAAWLLLIAAAALLAARALSRRIAAPVRRLRDDALAFGRGELDRPAQVVGPAEVEELADALNHMAKDIQARAAEREALLSELSAANAAKDRFLNVISHELRNPLSAIMAGVGFLRQALPVEGRAARALEIVERNASLQARLVEDLLDFSRIALGKIALQPIPIPLDRVVRAACHAIQGEAEAAGLSLETDIQPHLWVSADPGRLQQAVTHLLSNAVKFTPSGRIRVRVWECESMPEETGDGRQETGAPSPLPSPVSNPPSPSPRPPARAACITVADTGIGISADLMPHLFDVFQQGRPADARTPGLGLGLILAKTLVAGHGGRIRAESEGPGKGSRFTIELPLLSGAEPSTLPPAPASP